MNITLYYFPECPYCQKVLEYLSSIKKEIPMKDIKTNEHYQNELIAIGGKKQVPCLVIDGEAMYESDDIIKWMKQYL